MGRYRRAGWVRRLSRADHRVVDECLDRVGMEPFARRQVGALSGGQRQRIFLARALAQQAPVLLMDEPFAGVDARTEAAILELLRAQRDEGRSIVVVHHDLATVRAAFDWALVLNVRTIACGPVSEVIVPDVLRKAYGVAALDAAGGGGGEGTAWAG
jgi:manganese/zinc/iron transport system ATP- binding protein